MKAGGGGHDSSYHSTKKKIVEAKGSPSPAPVSGDLIIGVKSQTKKRPDDAET